MKIQDGHELSTAFDFDLPGFREDAVRRSDAIPEPSHRWIAQVVLLAVALVICVLLSRLAK